MWIIQNRIALSRVLALRSKRWMNVIYQGHLIYCYVYFQRRTWNGFLTRCFLKRSTGVNRCRGKQWTFQETKFRPIQRHNRYIISCLHNDSGRWSVDSTWPLLQRKHQFKKGNSAQSFVIYKFFRANHNFQPWLVKDLTQNCPVE